LAEEAENVPGPFPIDPARGVRDQPVRQYPAVAAHVRFIAVPRKGLTNTDIGPAALGWACASRRGIATFQLGDWIASGPRKGLRPSFQ